MTVLTHRRYLEAEAAGVGEDFSLTPGEEEVLLPIAEKLNCRGLADLCLKRRGEFTERVRKEGIPWEEIVERNSRGTGGECLILIDGAVFDITRWLPEHPGGNSIIPKQVGGVAFGSEMGDLCCCSRTESEPCARNVTAYQETRLIESLVCCVRVFFWTGTQSRRDALLRNLPH